MVDNSLLIERILETENLTDELEDADAKWLLDWGTGQLDQVLQGVENDEAANDRVTALMAYIRKINRIVGRRARKDPEALAVDLAELAALNAQLSGSVLTQDPASYLVTANLLKSMTARQAVEFLARGDRNQVS